MENIKHGREGRMHWHSKGAGRTGADPRNSRWLHLISQNHQYKECSWEERDVLRMLHRQHRSEWLAEKNGETSPVPVTNNNEDVERIVSGLETLQAHVETLQRKLDETVNEKRSTRQVEIVTPERKVRKVGQQHMAFEKLVTYTTAGLNVALKGPAGSGKTQAASSLAKALKLPVYVVPLGPQTSKSDLLGFINGAGDYVPSLLRKAYEGGGVCLLDEMDAANPAVLTIINGLLANGHAGFADAMVDKHDDTIFLAAMNTFGRGADTEYVGRAQLDAATLDRWVLLEWDYDWSFTRQLAQNDDWTDYVRSVYEAAVAQRVRCVIGPRAALHGAKLLAAKVDRAEVEQVCIWAPIKPDDQAKIRAAMPQPKTEPVVDGSTEPFTPAPDGMRCSIHGRSSIRPSKYGSGWYCAAKSAVSKNGFCSWRAS